MIRRAVCFFVTPLLAVTALASDQAEKTYPLNGTVVAMHTSERMGTIPVYTDPYGKTHGGGSVRRRAHVYTVRTADMRYEIEGRILSINDHITFRVEKDKVFVQSGRKELKYFLVGQESVTAH